MMKQLLLLLLAAAVVGEADEDQCEPWSCGDLRNISYPFRLKGDPRINCGDPHYELACENNRTILYLYHGSYYVLSINYRDLTMQVVDTGLQAHNCSSLPRRYNFTNDEQDQYRLHYVGYEFVLLNCGNDVVNSSDYVDTSPCIHGPRNSSTYVRLDAPYIHDLKEGCTIELVIQFSAISGFFNDEKFKNHTFTYNEIHSELLRGVELDWSHLLCQPCFRRRRGCYFPFGRNGLSSTVNCVDGCEKPVTSWHANLACEFVEFWQGADIVYGIKRQWHILAYVLAGRIAFAIICISAFFIYKFRRRHLSMDESLESFLQSPNLMPIRYSYSEIKKITKGFKNKLGQGGFGSVFSGTLRSGRLVAVKMLAKSKTNGQDFVNEVATIGRIHHVNVVRLIGFCVEGSKRALVYDFMPNGSLEKYIFPREEEGICLSWGRAYDIAMGVASGIEYLHRGCHMQILHFDIKPHNILLDDKFIPKVSDFGLAKLYPVDRSGERNIRIHDTRVVLQKYWWGLIQGRCVQFWNVANGDGRQKEECESLRRELQPNLFSCMDLRSVQSRRGDGTWRGRRGRKGDSEEVDPNSIVVHTNEADRSPFNGESD